LKQGTGLTSQSRKPGRRKVRPRSAAPAGESVRPSPLVAERQALLGRLGQLPANAKRRPGYRTVLALLGRRFHAASQATQMALLQAATFMVDILEKLPPG